ncbi:hypothetical protein IM40_04235 [Candidatus Paracaedimonas acanthamoebae]|nr:hypothetical protein IM40_04235 [Candidatus Paracaedimonas acanthamoebae]
MWNKRLKEINQENSLQTAIRLWAIDYSSSKLISEEINIVYRFDTPQRSLFLRISPYSEQIFNNISNSLELQSYLFNNKVHVAQPILSLTGSYIEKIYQERGTYILHLIEGVPGSKRNFSYIEPEYYKHWGKSLAQLHKELQNVTSNKKSYFKSWQDSWKEIETYIEKESNDVKEKYKEIDSWLNFHHFNIESLGLIHGDHQCQNVFYDGTDTYFIDFDEVTYHWYGLDIIMPFLELFGSPFKDWEYKLKAFLEGYQLLLPINIQSLYYLANMKSLEIYLNCKNKWTLPTGPRGETKNQWIDSLHQMAINPLLPKNLAI